MGQHKYDNPKPRKPREEKPRVQWHFIDYNLTPMDKETLRGLIDEGDLYFEQLTHLVDAGYEVRLKIDENGGGVRAMLIDPDYDESPDFHILTGRGATSHGAIFSVLYRHFVVAQEDWSTLVVAGNDVPDFG